MKKEIFLVFFIFNSISIIAQTNQVKIGGGMGVVPYEASPGWNVEFQYEYIMNPKFSGFIALGISGDDFTSQGRSQGTDGTDTWDNSWRFKYSEQFKYFDLGLKYKLFKRGEIYEMKGSIGGTVAQSVFEYPEDIYINRGIIEEQNDITRKVEVGMLLLGIENYVYITDRFFFNLNLVFRTTFKEKHILTREIRLNNASISSTSGILNVVNLNVQVGYQF